MQKSAHFRVDPKLAHVLGESYTSSEKALKELVDNAWDAEATEVHVNVPNIHNYAPIIVQDNGDGMKTAELEAEYLNIASPRFSRKGDRAEISYTIADKPLPGKKSGLNVGVGGKSIGKPHFFGLENDDALSVKPRNQIDFTVEYATLCPI